MFDEPAGAHLSADGSRLFVAATAGIDFFAAGHPKAVVLAYDTQTGSLDWKTRVDSARSVTAAGLSIDPSGSPIYMTGDITARSGKGSIFTAAFDPETGDRLWINRYEASTTVQSIQVDALAGKVLVLGARPGEPGNAFVNAYAGDTGALLWRTHGLAPPAFQLPDTAIASPAADAYFTASEADSDSPGQNALLLVALDPETGSEMWQSKFVAPTQETIHAAALSVTPDGSTLIAAGDADLTGYFTGGWNSGSGQLLWSDFVPNGESAGALSMAADGSSVFVSGGDIGGTGPRAYEPTSGGLKWVASYPSFPGIKYGGASDLSPDGSTLFVTGSVLKGGKAPPLVMTEAYDASTGAGLWHAFYGGPSRDKPAGGGLAVSSTDGSGVFVVGTSVRDLLILRYSAT